MNSLPKHNYLLRGAGLKALLLSCLTAFTVSISWAQLTNGVFDPSKVMVAKDSAKKLESFKKNITTANEFNKTLGTPAHPRPHIPNFDPNEFRIGQARDEEVPDFDTSRGRRNRGNEGAPEVSAIRLDPSLHPPSPPASEPSVSANPISIAPADSPGSSSGTGFFSRFRRQRGEEPNFEIDMNEDPGTSGVDSPNPDLPPGEGGISTNSAPDADMVVFPDENGEMVMYDENGLELPSYSQQEEESGSGFLKFLGFGRKTNRAFDVPRQNIPITINSASRGNPYLDPNFRAGPEYSALLDNSEMRDMTSPGSRPIGSEIAMRGTERPASDLKQYLVVVKEGLIFQPFRHNSEEVDSDLQFDLYAGAVLRDLGIVGTKRMVQIDSGERGLVAKSGTRHLTVSEEAVMENGLKTGRPWYSILDTEAEMGEFAAALNGDKPKPKPAMKKPSPKPVTFSNGLPEDDLSQYYIIRTETAKFQPFINGTDQLDDQSGYGLLKGALIKNLGDSGARRVVKTESGEIGLLGLDTIRGLTSAEREQMTQGFAAGKRWYSILNTSPAPRVMAQAANGGGSKPSAGKVKTGSIERKPESDTSQYFVVKTEGAKIRPIGSGGTVDSNASFELWKGAVVKSLKDSESHHVIRTESGETGLISVDDVRSLSEGEKTRMAEGISNGRPWYSILDTE